MLKTKCETVNKWGETIVKKTLFYLSLKEFRKRLQSGSTWCYHLAQKHIVNFRRECQQNFKQILRRKCLFTVYENSRMDSEEGKNMMGSRLIKTLSEIEELAEEIMADKEQVFYFIRKKSFNLLVFMGNNDL